MSEPQNLPLRERRLDMFFAVTFLVFAVTCVISDAVPTLGIEMTPDSPNVFARMNYWYAVDADPLFMHPPVMMRFITGLSAFVYGPFYLVLAWALVKGKNGIQLPALIYATMIVSNTGILVFGTEFFGEPQYQTHNALKFLSLNLPYVLIPLLLGARMRKPLPFTRTF
jgi:hypothetical protein